MSVPRAAVRLILGTASILTLAGPGFAQAQEVTDPSVFGSIQTTGRVLHDEQFTRLDLPLQCYEAQAGRSDCLLRVTTRYQWAGGYPKYEPVGTAVVADVRDVTIPLDSEQHVIIETTKILTAIAKRGGNLRVSLAVTMPGSQATTEGQTFALLPRRNECAKGDRTVYPWSGKGTLRYETDKGGDGFGNVSGTVRRKTLLGGAKYRVTKGSVSYTFRGVKTTISKGGVFTVTCSALTDVGRGKSLVSPYLYSGKVTVRTSGKMSQLAAYVATNEGVLGTRRKERATFTVTRRNQISRLKVSRGKSGGITPFNTRERSPCTQGRSLKVDRRGRISRG